MARDRDVCSSEAMRQRYDEFAEWYDTYVTSGAGQPFARSADRLLGRLLGPGDDVLDGRHPEAPRCDDPEVILRPLPAPGRRGCGRAVATRTTARVAPRSMAS